MSRKNSRDRGLRRLADHLCEFPGDTWQQRWDASGLHLRGNPVRRLATASHIGASLTQAIEALLALRIVQPTLEAFRSNIFKEYPAAFRGAQHDPDLDRYFVAVAAADTTRHFKRWALFDVCCALTTQGIAFADLTPEAFLHYARTTREAAMAAYSISTYVGHLDGDPELLAQAVRNLVENALRHGLGTPVEVRVTATRVQVRDHGPGVPPQDRTRVFERRVTGAASTGTGLAIVAWVAGLHGGTARISQAPGGASVELLLPERAGR